MTRIDKVRQVSFFLDVAGGAHARTGDWFNLDHNSRYSRTSYRDTPLPFSASVDCNMPTTINGIGTHYYGKQDLATRPGVCPHCKCQGNLESYTTRLWFVIVFIPIIPLKRVRVLDSCPACRRHWAADPEKFEEARQTAVSEALEKHRSTATKESALEAHAQCLIYHMYKEAELFREGVLKQFPRDEELLRELGSHLDQSGRWQDATPLYEQLLELKPDALDIRGCLAWRRTNDGHLDDAYELLDFLREPGAGKEYKLDALQLLAQKYQTQGDHEKTLELCEVLLRETPWIGEKYEFRKLASKSERALQRTTSMLPERKFSLGRLLDSQGGTAPWIRKTVIASLILGPILIILAGANEYIRRHRTLYVLSGFAQPVQVSIDGGPSVTVNRTKIPISEGRHQISITGPITRQIEAEFRTSYFSRWLSSPMWVMDIEGLSNLYVSHVHYAVNPRPNDTEWLTEEVNFVPHVDYPFEQPPPTLKLDSEGSEVTKILVGTMPSAPASTLMAKMQQPDRSIALTFAEGHLAQNPKDAMLLGLYCQTAKDEAEQGRVQQFLQSRLWNDPISVEWHRAYQSLKSVESQPDQLLAEYDVQLQKAPNNAALLYLKGRISLDRAEQLRLFRQSFRQNDRNQGWPAMALAVDSANRGDWSEAKQMCDLAEEKLGQDPSVRNISHSIQMALGECERGESEYREQLKGNDLPNMMTAIFYLTESLASQGKYDQVRSEYLTWWNQISGGRANAQGRTTYELLIDYLCGDTDAFLRKQADLQPDELSFYQFQFLLATGQPDAALKLPDLPELTTEWSNQLALSVSFELQGNKAESEQWLAKSIATLRSEDPDAVRAAECLSRDRAPTDAELDEIILRIAETPLFLVALAQKFPDRRADLKQRAAKLNVGRLAPYLLVKQTIDKL